MNLYDFDFHLPEDRIALRPVSPRRAARMLVWDGAIHDSQAAALPDWLTPRDLLVFNTTKVIPARLNGTRKRATADGSGVARVEVTLLKDLGNTTRQAFAKPAKKLKPGDQITFTAELRADVIDKGAAGEVTLAFGTPEAEFRTALETAGDMPLPPYIAAKRAVDERDRSDYQTVFAEEEGSVAAPTASLHFDEVLLAALAAKGVQHTTLTLHVGAGTFLPVKTENLDEHRMHSERGSLSQDAGAASQRTKSDGGRVIAVGTTALRLLETAGAQEGPLAPWVGDTDIFIRPGHRFQVADGLMTNFHLPKSTLIMLVAALVGLPKTQAIYAHAVAENYRFFSYGDASLL